MDIKEKPPEFFKSTKTSLKSILKHPIINTPILEDAVLRSHKIVVHTLQFLKLYLLHQYQQNSFPVVTKKLINSTLKIVCGEKEEKRGKPANTDTKELQQQLSLFYQEHYQPTMVREELNYAGLNTVLDYLTEDIITMYENNIQLHYVEYVERYVNVMWKKKFFTEKIRKLGKTKAERESRIRKLCSELRKIKNDLLNVDNTPLQSKSYYHSWIQQQKKHILPNKQKFQEKSIYYDLKCSPMDYLPCMIFMMKQVENEDCKVCNVFPIRSSIVPSYIRLDTTTLVNLLLRKEHGTKSHYKTEGNLKKNEDKIWNFFFRTELKCFKKTEYSFHHMLSTDGVSVSILLLRKDLVGKKLPMMKKKSNHEIYIDEITDTTSLQTKKIVGIDAGKCDLIYCVDDASKEANVFRYSQDQRRKETKMKKYTNIRLGLKHKVLEGKTIIEYETELSNYNRKTLQIDKFKEYLQAKNKLNHLLFGFYRKEIFRKLKMSAYINAKRTEQKMIQQFQDKFGKPDETILCIGDWEQRKQMKFKEPTIGIGMRTLFRKRGYQVYLVDEFRTSCRCSNCNGGICKKFKVVNHPNPKKEEMRLIHGLLRCQNGCGLWNRDRNGASNIYKIAYQAIHKLERPSYLCRETSNHTTLPSSKKPTLRGYVKTQP